MSDTPTPATGTNADTTDVSKRTEPTQPKVKTPSSGTPWLPIFLAAVSFALLYAVVSVVTYERADDQGMTETVWSRLIFVLHGLEAIAFTAVGWIFGREVHRAEAKQAKEEAKDAKAQAESAQQESAAARQSEKAQAERASTAEIRGWRLAEAVRTQRTPPSTNEDVELEGDETGGYERHGAFRGARVIGGNDYVRDLADNLFPPPS